MSGSLWSVWLRRDSVLSSPFSSILWILGVLLSSFFTVHVLLIFSVSPCRGSSYLHSKCHTFSVSYISSSHCLVKSFFFFLLALSASELDVLLGIRSSNCLSTEVNQIARTVSDAGYYLKCLMCLLHGDKISVIFKACLRNVLSKLDSHSTWGKCLLFIVWLSATWLCKAVLWIQLALLLFFVDHWPTLPLLPRLL